ncbi:MAG: STAS domain-containing protein [Bacteroidetes bacterium]|nr:STAS domain-containing protein [Bacteroidota bacterium]
MKFSINKQDRYSIFKIEDENVNTTVAPDLKSEFFLLSSRETENLIVDLSLVKYIDSSGLSAILTAHRIWKEMGGSFVITGVKSPVVEKLFQISRIGQVVTILPTVQSSIEHVLMGELERELNSDEGEGEGTELEEEN